MTSSPNDDRRFSDEEFALILRRAAELQEGGTRPPALRTGMSLEEIQAVAQEAGIDPDKVAQAAAALPNSAPAGRVERILGGPASLHLEHVAQGELAPEDLGRLLDVIRRSTRRQGQGAQVLDTFEWRTMQGPNPVYVNVTPRDGRTTVQIVADHSGTGVAAFLGSTVAWVLAALIVGGGLDITSVEGVAAIFVGAGAGAFATFRAIWKSSSLRFRRKVAGLMADLAAAVDDAIGDRR